MYVCSTGAYGPWAGHNTGCWGSSAVHTVPRCNRYSCTVTGSLAPEVGDPGSTDSALVECCITILCPWTGDYKSSRQAHFRSDQPPASMCKIWPSFSDFRFSGHISQLLHPGSWQYSQIQRFIHRDYRRLQVTTDFHHANQASHFGCVSFLHAVIRAVPLTLCFSL